MHGIITTVYIHVHVHVHVHDDSMCETFSYFVRCPSYGDLFIASNKLPDSIVTSASSNKLQRERTEQPSPSLPSLTLLHVHPVIYSKLLSGRYTRTHTCTCIYTCTHTLYIVIIRTLPMFCKGYLETYFSIRFQFILMGRERIVRGGGREGGGREGGRDREGKR